MYGKSTEEPHAGWATGKKTTEETHISVATPRMLYRMKRDTVRPQDRLDAEVIKEAFKLEED